jgi:hypothetical protein
LISFNIFPVTKIAEIDEKERKSLFNKEQIQTKTLFYNKNKGLIKGYWRIIPPHSVLMTEIRGIFNLPIENSSR